MQQGPARLPDVAPASVTQAGSSPWAKQLAGKLSELAALPRGWDGYNSGPVGPAIIEFAVQLIDRLYVPGLVAPQPVPGGDGTLQLEWHVNQFDLEIDIRGPCQLVAWLDDLETGTEEEIEVKTDLSPLVSWVRRVQQRSQG